MQISKEMKHSWISALRKTFQNDQLASNVVFSFLLVVLEKLVDMEFACPCKQRWENAFFVAAYFLIPGILAIVLMNNLRKGKVTLAECSKTRTDALQKIREKAEGNTWIIPGFVWSILWFLDGRYFACGTTDWPGRYVTADKADPVKWCETNNNTLYEERLRKSQDWYFISQVWKKKFFS